MQLENAQLKYVHSSCTASHIGIVYEMIVRTNALPKSSSGTYYLTAVHLANSKHINYDVDVPDIVKMMKRNRQDFVVLKPKNDMKVLFVVHKNMVCQIDFLRTEDGHLYFLICGQEGIIWFWKWSVSWMYMNCVCVLRNENLVWTKPLLSMGIVFNGAKAMDHYGNGYYGIEVWWTEKQMKNSCLNHRVIRIVGNVNGNENLVVQGGNMTSIENQDIFEWKRSHKYGLWMMNAHYVVACATSMDHFGCVATIKLGQKENSCLYAIHTITGELVRYTEDSYRVGIFKLFGIVPNIKIKQMTLCHLIPNNDMLKQDITDFAAHHDRLIFLTSNGIWFYSLKGIFSAFINAADRYCRFWSVQGIGNRVGLVCEDGRHIKLTIPKTNAFPLSQDPCKARNTINENLINLVGFMENKDESSHRLTWISKHILQDNDLSVLLLTCVHALRCQHSGSNNKTITDSRNLPEMLFKSVEAIVNQTRCALDRDCTTPYVNLPLRMQVTRLNMRLLGMLEGWLQVYKLDALPKMLDLTTNQGLTASDLKAQWHSVSSLKLISNLFHRGKSVKLLREMENLYMSEDNSSWHTLLHDERSICSKCSSVDQHSYFELICLLYFMYECKSIQSFLGQVSNKAVGVSVLLTGIRDRSFIDRALQICSVSTDWHVDQITIYSRLLMQRQMYSEAIALVLKCGLHDVACGFLDVAISKAHASSFSIALMYRTILEYYVKHLSVLCINQLSEKYGSVVYVSLLDVLSTIKIGLSSRKKEPMIQVNHLANMLLSTYNRQYSINHYAPIF